MRRSRVLQWLLAAAVCAVAANTAQADGFKVNGAAIPQARIDFVVRTAIAQGQADSPALRSKVMDELITIEVLLQEANRKGLDKDPEIMNRVEMQRQKLLINAYLEDYVKANPVAEEVMKKEYDQAKAQADTKEYKARHILVETEAEAKQIIATLKKGGNFGKIAARKSKDPGSKGNGGALDWSPANRYAPPFAEALGKLKKGQLADKPVQTPFGWHVIRLEDERIAKFPEFEEVKPQIREQMQQQVIGKLIDDLRAKAKIEQDAPSPGK